MGAWFQWCTCEGVSNVVAPSENSREAFLSETLHSAIV